MRRDGTTAVPMTGWRAGRAMALVEVAIVVGLIIADLHHLVPFSKVPFLFVMAWASLRLRGLRWRDVGLARPGGWARAIVLGTVAGIAMETLSVFLSEPLFERLIGKPPELADFRPLVGNLGLLAAAMALNWTLAAFGEEMVFRGWLMNRVAGLGGGTRTAWLVSLIVVNALFGWGHVDQQATGMLQAGLDGLLLGILYLVGGRKLAVPVVAHGVSNTMALVMIYCGRYPGL